VIGQQLKTQREPAHAARIGAALIIGLILTLFGAGVWPPRPRTR